MTTSSSTESTHSEHSQLQGYDTATLVSSLIGDQARAAQAVARAAPDLAAAVDAALPLLQQGGRLLYVGAGTSGRLGVLDSVELWPTFSWPRDRAVGLLAGGSQAMFVAVEGAEDREDLGAQDLQALQPTASDVAVLIAASGTTPYVLGAARAAREAGALTVGLTNNAGSPLTQAVAHPVVLDTGPEMISGSTRLKAGTAQKIALNTFSSALMVRLHKVWGNLMVDLQATNHKLRARALRLTELATGAPTPQAQEALSASNYHVKTAIVMLRAGVSADRARDALAAAQGNIEAALKTASTGQA